MRHSHARATLCVIRKKQFSSVFFFSLSPFLPRGTEKCARRESARAPFYIPRPAEFRTICRGSRIKARRRAKVGREGRGEGEEGEGPITHPSAFRSSGRPCARARAPGRRRREDWLVNVIGRSRDAKHREAVAVLS